MRVSLIVAAAENGVIGRSGGLPWRLSADLAAFKRRTMGHHLLVGRRTWESIARPLPGRHMLVVSRRAGLPLPEGVRRVASPDEGLEVAAAAGEDELFVAGGGELYRQLLPRAERVYLTRVLARVEGDVRFPALDAGWERTASEEHPADERNAHPFRFETWERRPAAG
jgi:dihydrofolate reductase